MHPYKFFTTTIFLARMMMPRRIGLAYLLSILAVFLCAPFTANALVVTPKIIAGNLHAMVLKSDGSVWGWGLNLNGQLGLGDTQYRMEPTQIMGLGSITDLAAGESFGLALKSDGTVWAWGANDAGQLGLGHLTEQHEPQLITDFNDVVAIKAGVSHSIALKRDGSVWAWGSNVFGQLGLGDRQSRTRPTRVDSIANVIALASGAFHTIVLRSDQTVWSFGLNLSGQLGINSVSSDELLPRQLANFFAREIYSGRYHSFAKKIDGTLWAWGFNDFGELGIGSFASSNTPVQIAGLADVRSLVAGDAHTLAISKEGQVWGWGEVDYGKLTISGDNLNVPTLLTRVSAGTVGLAAGAQFSLVLKSDGSVWSFGTNHNGELGIGTTVPDRSFPPKQVVSATQISSHFTTSPLVFLPFKLGTASEILTETLTVPGVMHDIDFDSSAVVQEGGLQLSYSAGSCVTGDFTGSCGFGVQISKSRSVGLVHNLLSISAGDTLAKAIVLPISASVSGASLQLLDLDARNVQTLLLSQASVKTLSFMNLGDADVQMNNVILTGDFYQLSADNCTGKILHAGERCTITLGFSSDHIGDYPGELDVDSDDPLTPVFKVALSRSVISVPILTLSTTSSDFNAVAVGSSKSIAISLQNTGTETLHVASISAEPASFSISRNTCSEVLVAGEQCSFDLNFLPTAIKTYTGVVNIDTDSYLSNHVEIILSGDGIAAPVSSHHSGGGTSSREACLLLLLLLGYRLHNRKANEKPIYL